MANQQHLDLLLQGVDSWNQWRQKHLDIEPDLNDVDLSGINLVGVDLSEVHLKRTSFRGARLERVSLSRAHLEESDLGRAYLQGADLSVAHLERANLGEAFLKGANLNRAYLVGACLDGICLDDASLDGTHLEGASLKHAHLEGVSFNRAHLEGADLSEAFFNNTTRLHDVILSNENYGSSSIADVHWNGINLAVVDWTSVKVLGDEQIARQAITPNGKKKYKATQVDEYRKAVRANRQLVVVLRDQGLNEEADQFAYQAQLLQRIVWRLQRRPLKYILSWFLDLLAGYGYKPMRSIIAYLLIVMGFAMTYYFLGQREHVTFSLLGSLVFSVTSFHGRGFFPSPGITNLDNPIIRLAAIEAVIGLLIEISFIATFTQRFFGR
jgi:uncharacterized protein YjbI with pentapeptide repeats